MNRLILFLFCVLLLCVPEVIAGHMNILAIQEVNNTFTGSRADLYLELHPGSGRVFLQTYPLSKLDTQVSTRFAKEIACDYFDLDCSRIDFIYTIRSSAGIVGGPSAGAAIAVLTALEVMGESYDDNITVTATINSGGTIGSVGGVKEKIIAGVPNVVISSTNRKIKEDNETIDMILYGHERGVNVMVADNLGEVMTLFTGKNYSLEHKEIVEPKEYTKIMSSLAKELCLRAVEMKKNVSIEENKTMLASIAIKEGNYYSAASYCFSANVEFRKAMFENLSDSEMVMEVFETKKLLRKMQNLLSAHEIKDMADLQTSLVVRQRIAEAQELLEDRQVAFAQERLFSAESWSKFFEMSGPLIHDSNLKQMALKKIEEAEVRYYYLNFLGLPRSDIKEKIDEARQLYNTGDYGYSALKSSLAKADANTVISVLGLSEDEIGSVVQSKHIANEKIIARTISKNNFPIMGYSYYKYSKSLTQRDNVSALIYAEYALELSNLDMYLLSERKRNLFKAPMWLIFVMGIVCGAIIGYIIARIHKPNRKPKRKTNRRLKHKPKHKPKSRLKHKPKT